MDREEAEWLTRVIRREPEKWIKVVAVEYNQKTQRHHILCYDPRRKVYQWIDTPRQWVRLKYRRPGPQYVKAAL
jgi:hypothetical protein